MNRNYKMAGRFGMAAVLAGIMMISGCAAISGRSGGNGINQETDTDMSVSGSGTPSPGASGSGTETIITGNGDTVTIEGAGAAADGSDITISASGTYRLTGTVSHGRITVDAGKQDEVRLVLDGFSISSPDYSAVYASQSGLMTIVLADGTENKVSDGAVYVYGGETDLENGEEKNGEENGTESDMEPDAAIFSKDDLVFEGNGTLTVCGNYKDGIRGKDEVTVNSGVYIIEAVNDGIKGKDSVAVNGGTVTITAGSDGIQSNNDTDQDKGYVKISGGTVSVEAGKKGILAETLVQIEGGTIRIDSQDDSIHSDGDVRITSGAISLSSGDDAVHADNLVEVSGGDISVDKSYEGLEGLCVDITGGTILINAEDDGINAAGGKDESGIKREPSGNPFAATEGAYIRIAGGDIKINASGDGIDSNGDLFLEGGNVVVEGPENGGNGALDYDGTGTVSGGTILAVGSAGMFQTFSESSSQPMLVVYFDEIQSAAATVLITDAEGNALLETEISRRFEALLFSSPDLKTGGTYQIKAGDETVQVSVDGILNQQGTPASGGFGRMPGGGMGGRGGSTDGSVDGSRGGIGGRDGSTDGRGGNTDGTGGNTDGRGGNTDGTGGGTDGTGGGRGVRGGNPGAGGGAGRGFGLEGEAAPEAEQGLGDTEQSEGSPVADGAKEPFFESKVWLEETAVSLSTAAAGGSRGEEEISVALQMMPEGIHVLQGAGSTLASSGTE